MAVGSDGDRIDLRRGRRKSCPVTEALVYAVGVAVSPVPIASIIVILTSPRARANGAAFVAGWALGIAVVVTALVALVDQTGLDDSDPSWIAIPELVLGSAFVAAALVIWIRRRRRREHAVPWLDAVDHLTEARSAALGVIFAVANPKVVALALGAALSLAEASADAGTELRAIVLFCAIGVTGVALPFALYLLFPGRSASLLSRLRAWLGRHEAMILAVLGLVLGAVFLRAGLTSL